MVHRRRLAAAGLALSTLVAVAACSTETVQTGERPHPPTTKLIATKSIGQPSVLKLLLAKPTFFEHIDHC